MSDDQAFPEVKSASLDSDPYSLTNVWSEGGLTKRELFAAMAMQGFSVSFSIPASGAEGTDPRGYIAKACVNLADALLAELVKERK